MALASGNFQALLEPKLRKVFFESYDEKPEEYSMVYHVAGSTKAKETDQHVATLGVWEKKEPQGPIRYDSINLGDEVTYTHEEYARGIQIERKLVDDEMYDVIDKLPATLGRGGRVIVETTAADILNDGFTDLGYDGKALFANDHPLAKSGVTDTADNLFTTALSDAGIREGRLLMKKQSKDEAGLKIQAMPDTVIVPDDLELELLVLLTTGKLTGGNYNDESVIKGKYKAVVMSYLTDASRWFMMDSGLHDLWFFWRVKPEFSGEENFDTMVAKYRGYLRFSCGYSNWRGVVASDPA